MNHQHMPAIFLGHGSPMNAIEDNAYTEAWSALGRRFPNPRAIVMVSAHWMTHTTAVTAMAQPKTIHDFGGFPPALYEMQYPAPGSPALAQQVADLLTSSGVTQQVALDQAWGLDHGTWSVLAKVYPAANIPVIQLSLNMNEEAPYHFAIGQQLAQLREQGVMIMASGNVVHNLRALNPQIKAYDWARRFDDLVRDTIVAGDFDKLIAFDTLGQDARYSIPTAEHFLPLLYILGAKGTDDSTEVICHDTAMGSISMTSYIFHRA
ncbi:4,5-DOPA dioxygenase extradiol [Undibacterium cyanobacteriorum]|uniref:4,5-DOPA dioxygenase extradiol n=2 Tax=Undibacterium cyanobacteriorum TaxID=3073561 RepID=A0ABY9RIR9_9BURK|nr:4,5-DOPA dioxygenase extradiol [Undibacterium sp. 20NA77.5]WMW80574.1 4,5-DOPA dioxygenase extradiol [Undibacterium sp. 20NA77.5]